MFGLALHHSSEMMHSETEPTSRSFTHYAENAKCTCTFPFASIFNWFWVILDSEVRMDSDKQSSAKCCKMSEVYAVPVAPN